MSALGNDDISVAFRRLDKLHVHRPDSGQVLFDHRVNRPSAFGNVTPEPSDETNVVGRVHKNLYVHLLEKARIGKDQNPFDDHDRLRLDQQGFIQPSVRLEIIDRELERLAGSEFSNMVDEEIVVQRIRMIKVGYVSVIEWQVFEIAVV